MYYIGADLGGTKIAAGLVTGEGEIIYQNDTPTVVGRPFQEILKDMADLILSVIELSNHNPAEICSVGIGSPGEVDTGKGEIIFANNLFWHHVPVRDEIQKYIHKPVQVGNDADVAGLAEYVAGACKGADPAILLTLGTGIGSGVIINGQIFKGANNAGSELGHMMIRVDGILCTCGNRGCLERYASATALIREGKLAASENRDSLLYIKVNGNIEEITAKIVMDSAKEGDPGACAIFDQFIYDLAMGIINMINIFDPAVIAIGGGISNAGPFLRDAIRQKVRENILYRTTPYARIELAQLGNNAGIIGAAMLGRK